MTTDSSPVRQARVRLEERHDELQLLGSPARSAPGAAREIEPQRNAVIAGEINRAAELLIAVVPVENDVLPHHVEARAACLRVDAREVREGSVEVTTNPVAPVGVWVRAVDREDQPVEQALAQDRVLDGAAYRHPVRRDSDRRLWHRLSNVAQRVCEVAIEKWLAEVVEIHALDRRT